MNKNILLPLMIVAAGVVSRWGLMGPGESTVVAVLREPDDIRGGKLQFQQRPAQAPVAVSALQPDFALPMTGRCGGSGRPARTSGRSRNG